MTEEQILKEINTRLNEYTLQLSEHLAQTVNGAVKLAVQEKVNGKIDKISAKFDDYIKTDNAWKETVEPVVEAFENIKWNGKALLWVAGFIVAITSAVFAIKRYFI